MAALLVGVNTGWLITPWASQASLLGRYGDLGRILAAASEPGTKIASGIRAKLAAAIDYLGSAPQVVCGGEGSRLGVGPDDFHRPTVLAHRRTFARLSDEYGLVGSADRVLAALAESRSS